MTWTMIALTRSGTNQECLFTSPGGIHQFVVRILMSDHYESCLQLEAYESRLGFEVQRNLRSQFLT